MRDAAAFEYDAERNDRIPCRHRAGTFRQGLAHSPIIIRPIWSSSIASACCAASPTHIGPALEIRPSTVVVASGPIVLVLNFAVVSLSAWAQSSAASAGVAANARNARTAKVRWITIGLLSDCCAGPCVAVATARSLLDMLS